MPDALGDAVCLRGAGVRQQAAELLAADPEQEIGRSDAGVDQTDDAGEHVVAACMAEAVVERLEVVEVEEQERQRRALVAVARHQPLAARHEGAAVERAGQRIGLRLGALLKLEPDIEIVASVADGELAWKSVQALEPDVILTDIEMPHLTGLELAQRVRDAGLECKVVILTTFARPGYLRRALDAGASGYLLKDAPAEKLADALRKVHRSGRAVDPELAVEAWSEADPLNDRERQVLRLAGEGMSAGEIAEQLHLSPGTVRNYLSEAIGKLGVGNRIEAYRLARQKGWL